MTGINKEMHDEIGRRVLFLATKRINGLADIITHAIENGNYNLACCATFLLEEGFKSFGPVIIAMAPELASDSPDAEVMAVFEKGYETIEEMLEQKGVSSRQLFVETSKIESEIESQFGIKRG